MGYLREREPATHLTWLRREWNQLRRPSRPFLTFLAAAGFAGALMLTPSAELSTPSWNSVVATRRLPRESKVRSPAPIDSASWEREVVARYDHLPLAQILRRSADPEIANRAARAIVKEARELRLPPSLLAGVLLTENSRLEPETVSHKGAIGLMQVMRFHAGVYDCDSDDLLQVEANICHGSRVFASYLKRTRDVRSALLRYNGCIRSRATTSCRRYPTKVLRQAEEIRQQLLLYLPRRKLSGA
ncbi:MAG TPA: transglycosylase SLT domain-containing protein [Gemmatimonadales bacterium]|nr:transglycosylase SLT domain-containing protein [Gemmatimonadales bacterium]